MEKKSKAETYVGFAIKARKVKTGYNACETLKKSHLIIVCKTASENTKKASVSLANKLKCGVLITKNETLESITYKDGIKVIAINDYNLAKAITEQAKDEFTPIL